MYHNEFFKEYAALNEATLSEERANETQPDVVSPPDFILWSPIGFVVGWAVLYFMLSKIGMAARDEIAVNIKRLHQAPCKKCQFYSNNHYLKCAIHPSTVLTEKAIGCSDYCPQNSKPFS